MKKKILFVFITLFIFAFKVSAKENAYEVHFINTGQSDCILIRTGGESEGYGVEKYYLIDTGCISRSDKVVNYLKAMNVSELESIIITHYHDDHYGGLNNIVNAIKVKNVLLPMHENIMRDDIFIRLLSENIKTQYIENGKEIVNGRMNLKLIAPKIFDSKVENNNSIAIIGLIDGIKYLFAADMEIPEEKQFINLDEIKNCNVLKVAHHALATSTSEEFLKKVKPKLAIATCDGDESPSYEVINRLNKNGALVIRTDLVGSIVVNKNDDNSINVKFSK